MSNIQTPPIGLLGEGPADLDVLVAISVRLQIRFARPVQISGQCSGSTAQVLACKKIIPKLEILARKALRKIVVVLDRESRPQCPGEFAADVCIAIQENFARMVPGVELPPIVVVCANRKIENWILADPAGIKRSKIIRSSVKQSVGNNSETCDAIQVIENAMGRGRSYIKTKDAGRLSAKVNVKDPKVLSRCRSLDKFVREVST